ncbi:GTP-binding protein [Aeromicrobium alkaliterrae]|uniref:GTP-binding protein n=1 Tax=Aeromicrobium alkaliterrae TaxID=302168 RepID=A0ABN2JUI5_9ACTN
MTQTPVILVTGIDDAAMEAATVGLQFDLPHAAVMRHTLDVPQQLLTRRVSDLTGLVEAEQMDLDHACVSCALREDIVPTLERLAATGRWGAIIAHLPVSAEALQVCRVVAMDKRIAPHVRISAVVHALDSSTAHHDLLGDDLLVERGVHTSEEDTRGLAEAHCALVEYADAIIAVGDLDEPDTHLVRALARPEALLVPDATALDPAALTGDLHQHGRTERWVDVVRRGTLPELESEHVWRLDLRATRPLHPGRLLDGIESLGGGPRRSRGCFWLPTRPGSICAWDGAGGQLSIGTASPWGRSTPLTRIVVTGVDDEREALVEAFHHALLSDAESTDRGLYWEVAHDGLEPWLGYITRAA